MSHKQLYGLIENIEHYVRPLFGFSGITDVEVFISPGTMVSLKKQI
ncbi:hypothetical protein [Chryseobacterium limigenitum]|nr:hypothetical protein [Chryseobacterium limigenitum]